MKRIRTALCLILAAALLAGCAFLPSDSEPETPAPTDPLTGLALEWQGQRPVAVAIENSTASTTQWGLSSASVVLEALTEVGTSTELCLVYPALAATPKVGRKGCFYDSIDRFLAETYIIFSSFIQCYHIGNKLFFPQFFQCSSELRLENDHDCGCHDRKRILCNPQNRIHFKNCSHQNKQCNNQNPPQQHPGFCILYPENNLIE